jgi:hypothetical protein
MQAVLMVFDIVVVDALLIDRSYCCRLLLVTNGRMRTGATVVAA